MKHQFKHTFGVLFFIIFISSVVFDTAQAQVSYSYDESGNRTSKTITLKI